jgi:hypothetical protein
VSKKHFGVICVFIVLCIFKQLDMRTALNSILLFLEHEENVPVNEGSDIGSNVAIVGNRICLQDDNTTLQPSPETFQLRKHFQHKGILRIDPDETKR